MVRADRLELERQDPFFCSKEEERADKGGEGGALLGVFFWGYCRGEEWEETVRPRVWDILRVLPPDPVVDLDSTLEDLGVRGWEQRPHKNVLFVFFCQKTQRLGVFCLFNSGNRSLKFEGLLRTRMVGTREWRCSFF